MLLSRSEKASVKTLDKPVVGVSACLLGEEVRFNGGHARNRYVTDVLSNFCQWLPLCPEVGMGMSTPRETLRLVGEPGAPRLIGNKTKTDYTQQLLAYAASTIAWLKTQNLQGFILKKKSPSCGLERLPVYHENGGAEPKGVGLFAAAVKLAFPLLPMEEDGRLHDAGLRELFLRKLYAYKRWCDLTDGEVSAADLVAFHTRHKLLLGAHHLETAKLLGRLVAEQGGRSMAELLPEYGRLFMACFEHPCGRNKQAHGLRRVAVRLGLSREDLGEIEGTIAQFQDRLLPLAAPVTLIRHHLRRQPDVWAGIPYYLNPYPAAAAGPSV